MTNEAKDVLESFSKDLVALCRKHQIGAVDCTVRLDSSATFLKHINFGYGSFRLTWNEGRHGVDSDIKVTYETHATFQESPNQNNVGEGK